LSTNKKYILKMWTISICLQDKLDSKNIVVVSHPGGAIYYFVSNQGKILPTWYVPEREPAPVPVRVSSSIILFVLSAFSHD